ncbi:TPA: hypothetical protein ACSK82_002838, partial [Listeria innocua]
MSIVIEQLVVKESSGKWGSPHLLEQIKNNISMSNADFLIICSKPEENILSQIQDYIARFPENMV